MNELKKTILGLWKPALKNFQEMTFTKINSPSLFRDMNNRWLCFCPSQALIHDSMPQAVLFIVFVIQYNFIENNIVNCQSNAKNKPQSFKFKIWQYASESAKVNNIWHMGIEKSTLVTRSN